jgi:hypothetical protein
MAELRTDVSVDVTHAESSKRAIDKTQADLSKLSAVAAVAKKNIRQIPGGQEALAAAAIGKKSPFVISSRGISVGPVRYGSGGLVLESGPLVAAAPAALLGAAVIRSLAGGARGIVTVRDLVQSGVPLVEAIGLASANKVGDLARGVFGGFGGESLAASTIALGLDTTQERGEAIADRTIKNIWRGFRGGWWAKIIGGADIRTMKEEAEKSRELRYTVVEEAKKTAWEVHDRLMASATNTLANWGLGRSELDQLLGAVEQRLNTIRMDVSQQQGRMLHERALKEYRRQEDE